jgi:hypothetical protein
VIGGKLIPGRPKSAGMIFYNDEGMEDGGLIFGGKTEKDGKYSAYGHFSFDQYNQDQIINLEYSEENGLRRQAIVQLSDAHSIPRLRLIVDSAGAASIEFLDDSGHRISGKESGKP